MFKSPELVTFKEINLADRANINVIEFAQDVPFSVKRIFYVQDIKAGETRGDHAHKELYECIIAQQGSFTVELKNNYFSQKYILDSSNQGLVAPPGHWITLENFSDNAVCMVLASDVYREDDYFRDFNEFQKWQEDLMKITSVPFLDFKRCYKDLKSKLDIAYETVMNSGTYILGDQVEEFEAEFAKFCDVKHAIGVANGLEAIELTLKAWEIGPGDEVLVAANSFIATALAVSKLGAKPIFVDIENLSYNINPELIEAKINSKTKAIALTHLYGQCADMEPIMALAKKHKLKVFEDSAQAHGAQYRGQNAGSMADAGSFSFYPTKNIGAFGDAGIITTNDDDLAAKLRLIRSYGSTVKYHHEILGTNSRLDELQAAFLKVKLAKLAEWNARKNALAQIYLRELANITDLELPKIRESSKHVWHVFALRVKNSRREKLMQFLAENKIGYNIHYPVPIHLQKAYEDLGHSRGDFPAAESFALEQLSLPLDAYHTEAEIKFVCNKVKEFFAVPKFSFNMNSGMKGLLVEMNPKCSQ